MEQEKKQTRRKKKKIIELFFGLVFMVVTKFVNDG
jgi:hypothetical protein